MPALFNLHNNKVKWKQWKKEWGKQKKTWKTAGNKSIDDISKRQKVKAFRKIGQVKGGLPTDGLYNLCDKVPFFYHLIDSFTLKKIAVKFFAENLGSGEGMKKKRIREVRHIICKN